MKNRFSPLFRVGTAIAVVCSTPLLCAATYIKGDNAADLDTLESWLDESGEPATTAPVNSTSSSDILIWDSRVTSENVVTMGDHIGFNTVRILDPGGPVVINGSPGQNVFTVTNNGGLDLSEATQDLTLGQGVDYRVASSNANITHNVPEGRTLTIHSNVIARNNASGITIHHPGAGTTLYTGPFRPSHVVIDDGEVHFNHPAGAERLNNDNNSTTVNGGLLVVNNTSGSATGSGPVLINDGGTLTGEAIIGGAVTLNSGGQLRPGLEGIGTLQTGALTLETGSEIHWEAANAVDADRVDVTNINGLTINGGTIHLYNAGTTDPFTGTGLFNLLGYSGAVGGGGVGMLTVAESSKIEGQTYTIGLSGDAVTLRIETGTRPESFWNVNANGNWSTPANWTGNGVPSGPGAIANLGGGGTTITAPRTVTLDSPQTVGILNFDSAQPFTLAGNDTLTFDDGEAAATLHVTSGSHVIATPLELPDTGVLMTIEDSASVLTVEGEMSGVGGVAKSGAGTLVLVADNIFQGFTSNGSGVLQIGAGGTTGAVEGDIANSGTLRFDRSDNFQVFNPISGSGSLDFAGTGTATLTQPNTYSGNTTISAGSVVIDHSEALQNSTLTYSTTGGELLISDFISGVILGGLAGDKAFPLTNSFGDPIDLTVGQNNSSTTFSGSGTGTGFSLTKVGTGSLDLSGTYAFESNLVVTAGTLSLDEGADLTVAAANLGTNGSLLRINGGTLNSSDLSQLTNASIGIEVTGGTANFDGGIITDGNNAAGGSFIHVTGGTLNAASISMSRGSLHLGDEPASGQTGVGLYINGGDVNISGALDIGAISGSNSSVSARMDSGSLTVAGPVTVGINNPTRWSVMDIAGGVFTSTDTESGVRIGSAFDGQAILHIRGEETVFNAERIQFGQPDFFGSTILNVTGGETYLGAGGMVIGSTSPDLISHFRLDGGVLGATADWSSAVPITINGSPIITAADAADAPHTITLSGDVNGSGSLTKSGSGTVHFTSPNIELQGLVIVESGTLSLGGSVDGVEVDAGGTLIPRGSLETFSASTIDGTLALRFDESSGESAGSIQSQDTLTLGAGAVLDISGSGSLGSPIHIVASAASGVTGTFSSVTGVPDGYILDYNYDDGSGVPKIALVSGEASPFQTWAMSFGLNGAAAGPAADPDHDGMKNLIEYAFGLNPTDADGPGVELGLEGDFPTLTFPHISGGDLTFTVEANDDLSGDWEVVHTFPAFTSAGTASFTDTVARGDQPARFLRLRVTVEN